MAQTLDQAVLTAGYFPALASTVLRSAIGAEGIRAHFVHAETTFDHDEVRRHMTALVITDTRLLRLHMDDGAGPSDAEGAHAASATVETTALAAIRNMAMTHVIHDPENFREGSLPNELVLAVGGSVHSRLDLEPANCGDQNCDADHGYTGSLMSDDVLVRVSIIADGEASMRALQEFSSVLQGAIGARG